MSMRRFLAGVVVAALIAVAMPVRREVVGLSMAPDLIPGDRVTTGIMPWSDRLRSPAIHERWIVALPDGTEAIKRIAAIGPATLRIVDGDLDRDGRIAPPSPAVFVERATVVREMVVRETAIAAGGEERLVVADGEPILDDAAFATNERRVLLPVADVGVCVVVRVDHAAEARPTAEVVIGYGDRQVRWRPSGPGTFAFLAGRLDWHFVGVAWRLRENAVEGGSVHGSRPPRLPSNPPSAWSVKDVWTGADVMGTLPMNVAVVGDAPASSSVTVERVLLWRDVLRRPAADGSTAWTLASGEVFLLGDFPSGSIDSRQFGPIPRSSLRHRVTMIFREPISIRD